MGAGCTLLIDTEARPGPADARPAPDDARPEAAPAPALDGGAPDARSAPQPDAGAPDAGPVDPDASDLAVPDGAAPDADQPDADQPDADRPDAGPAPLANTLLSDPGFEAGESWAIWPLAGHTHAWARAGDRIAGAPFEPFEGRAAQRLWVPAGQAGETTVYQEFQGLDGVGAVEAEGWLWVAPDDRLPPGHRARLVVRAFDAEWNLIDAAESVGVDADAPVARWLPQRARLAIPPGARVAQVGVAYLAEAPGPRGAVVADALAATADGAPRWRPTRALVWHDEFDEGPAPGAPWTVVEWPPFQVNGERQRYTADPANVRVQDGRLVLEAHPLEPAGRDGAEFTSGRVNTASGGSWRYGRFEARLRLPTAVGAWPAFWMLPTDDTYGDWPASGELDIMEWAACAPDETLATTHTLAFNHLTGGHRGAQAPVEGLGLGFHTYTLDWRPDHLRFTVDGHEVFSLPRGEGDGPDAWPFDQRFHLVLNLAVGGMLGEACGLDAAGFPARLEVDWVRVYQTAEEIESTAQALP